MDRPEGTLFFLLLPSSSTMSLSLSVCLWLWPGERERLLAAGLAVYSSRPSLTSWSDPATVNRNFFRLFYIDRPSQIVKKIKKDMMCRGSITSSTAWMYLIQRASVCIQIDTHCRPIHESSFFFSFLFFFRVSYPQSRSLQRRKASCQ